MQYLGIQVKAENNFRSEGKRRRLQTITCLFTPEQRSFNGLALASGTDRCGMSGYRTLPWDQRLPLSASQFSHAREAVSEQRRALFLCQ